MRTYWLYLPTCGPPVNGFFSKKIILSLMSLVAQRLLLLPTWGFFWSCFKLKTHNTKKMLRLRLGTVMMMSVLEPIWSVLPYGFFFFRGYMFVRKRARLAPYVSVKVGFNCTIIKHR